MAATKGKDGGFYVGSTLVTFISSWNLNRGKGTAETTAYGDDWEDHVGLIRNWSADVVGTLDRTDVNQAALLDQLEDGVEAPIVVRLSLDRSTEYWQGSAIIAGDSIASDVKDKVTYNITLQGTAELTWEGS
jgi:predicted secreted protein